MQVQDISSFACPSSWFGLFVNNDNTLVVIIVIIIVTPSVYPNKSGLRNSTTIPNRAGDVVRTASS